MSFEDSSGVRHAAEVTAETLFEAAVLGIRAIRQQWAVEPVPRTRLAVRVQGPVTEHELSLKQLQDWLDSNCRSPKEKLTKARLKELLTRDVQPNR